MVQSRLQWREAPWIEILVTILEAKAFKCNTSCLHPWPLSWMLLLGTSLAVLCTNICANIGVVSPSILELSGYSLKSRLPPLRIIGMKIAPRAEALVHGVQPDELDHLFKNWDQIVIVEFEPYHRQQEPWIKTQWHMMLVLSLQTSETVYTCLQEDSSRSMKPPQVP